MPAMLWTIIIALLATVAALIYIAWRHEARVTRIRRERRSLVAGKYVIVNQPVAEAGSSRTPNAAPALTPLTPPSFNDLEVFADLHAGA